MKSLPTFRSLERQNYGSENEPPPGYWPLEVWYAGVYDKPLAEFTADDLATSCRQQLFPEAVVPYCLEMLEDDVLCGARYDGELLSALGHLPKAYWKGHGEAAARIVGFARSVLALSDDDALKGDLTWLINRIETA